MSHPDPAVPTATAADEPAGQDWDPRSPEVLADQVAAYDELRSRCPVAHDDYLGWTVLTHADVVAVLEDHATFSNRVSRRLTVPNGMDPPEHTPFRAIQDRYFTPERMAATEPVVRDVAARLVDDLPHGEPVELMDALADVFALRVQSRWMGWPESLEEPLREWTRKNHEATLARDTEAMGHIALEFDSYIREQLDARRDADPTAPDADLTTEIMSERVDGRPLTDQEIVSMLRNWTVGELGTIAASVGIIGWFLATRPDVQADLRAGAVDTDAAIDEILRIHPPLVSNRRTPTRDVEMHGRHLRAGDRMTVLWASANRDESVFGDPDEFRPAENAPHNLLYGRGIHACPGAPLARLELRVVTEELLARTSEIAPAPGEEAVPAVYPAGGFSRVPVVVR